MEKINYIIYTITTLFIIILLVEHFHLKYLESNIIDFNDSFVKYRKFSKYYFQLFPLTLSLACIEEDSSQSKNILSSLK